MNIASTTERTPEYIDAIENALADVTDGQYWHNMPG